MIALSMLLCHLAGRRPPNSWFIPLGSPSVSDNTGSQAADILVVVPTLNEESHIADCLRTILRDPGDVFTVVVADGGSRDDTCAIVKSIATSDPRLHLMANPDRLQSAGINAAVATYGSQAQILVRCDAHAHYPPNYVNDVASALRERQVAAVVVPMDARGDTEFARAAAWIVDTPLGSGGAAHRGGRVSCHRENRPRASRFPGRN